MNDTTTIQNLLNAGAGGLVQIPAGRYICDGLTIKSGTKLYGPGVTIAQAPSLPSDRSLLWNEHIGGAINTYLDKDIVIDGIVFDGQNLPHMEALVFFIKTLNCKFINSSVINTPYIGLGIGNGKGNVVSRSFFSKTGNPVETTEGGAAVWIDGVGGNECYGTEVTNCLFRDLQWSAIYVGGFAPFVVSNVLENIGESAIFCANRTTAPLIRNNIIRNVRRKHISASGIEIGANNAIIENNFIEDVGNGCIDGMDCSNAVVRFNQCRNPGQEERYASFAGAIQFITMPGSPEAHDILIEDNWVFSGGPAVRGIAFDRQPSAPQVSNVLVQRNNAAGSSWAHAFYEASGMFGANCVVKNNVSF